MNEQSIRKKRYPVIAVILAFFVPGLGQIYNGRVKRGVVDGTLEWLSIGLLVAPIWYSFPGFVTRVILLAGIPLFALVDSAFLSWKIKMIALAKYNKWYVYLALYLCTLALVQVEWALVKGSRFQTFRQPTSSMEPTIVEGEILIADRGYYQKHPIAQGEVVAVKFPNDTSVYYLRRCLALQGQVVQFRNRIAYVDGKKVVAPGYYLGTQYSIRPEGAHETGILPDGAGNSDNYGPVTVPQGMVFLVGDNIANVFDSRHWGFVNQTLVRAKLLYVAFPSSFSRLGTTIQ